MGSVFHESLIQVVHSLCEGRHFCAELVVGGREARTVRYCQCSPL